MRKLLLPALTALGYVLITVGVAMLHLAAGVIAGGILTALLAWQLEDRA